jgi:hypothetical protein
MPLFDPFSPGMPLGPYMPPGLMVPYVRQQQQQPTFQAVSHRPRSPMEDYRTPEIPPAPRAPVARAPVDIAMPPQPAAASPTGWWENLQKMLQGATAGIDPARTPGRPPSTPDPSQFIRQPRTIQTTDPGAGYGMSPSGPTAQMPPRQLRPQGVNSAGQRVVSQFDPQINPLDHSVLPNLDSPSFWAQQPARTPKPMSPFYEGPPPSSPSNPNWRPPGG